MLKKDYLLAQITELAKKFARLIQRKAEGEDITLLTDDYYGELNLSADWLQNASAEDIMSRVGNWQLIELLVKMIVEDSRFDHNRYMIEKAQTLLFMVQEADRTFSFERVELQSKIQQLLK